MEVNKEDQVIVKKLLIKTLSKFQSICSTYSLTYYAAYGTCLGAIRHKGFIPWDDDIDLVMPRDDYEKLKSLSNNFNGTGYELLDYDNCEGYTLPFMKFCDANTTIWEEKSKPCIFGVFIDIFPLDEAENKESALPIFSKYNTSFKYAFEKRIHNIPQIIKGMRLKALVRKLWHLIFHNYYIKQFKYIERSATESKGAYYIVYCGFYKIDSELVPRSWYGEGTIVSFENITIKVPKDYHSYLQKLYGDYMTPPPVEKQVSHHNIYYYNMEKRFSLQEVKKFKIKPQEAKTYKYE